MPTIARRKKPTSFADWMAKLDADVTDMARKMERKPPTFADLHPAQRRIVQMVIDHLRGLPGIGADENEFSKPEYVAVNRILSELFTVKYPGWVVRAGRVRRDIEDIPNGEGKAFSWMMRNCAGHAVVEPGDEGDDD